MSAPRHWIRRLLAPAIGSRRALVRDERGAVAVEFGLLALPFFGIIFAIIETAVVFLAGQILDAAVQDASRNIRTGEAQTLVGSPGVPTWDENDFKDAVCDALYGMFDCDGILIRVDVIDNFADATFGSPVSDDCLAPGATAEDCEEWAVEPAYLPGAGSDIVQVQAFYRWPTLINLPWFDLATQAGGKRLLSAVRVFKNEPFS